MKINTIGSALKTNNNNADSIEFGIGDVSTIIDILRNRLYANPIRTLTQEYLCNARDSHREAGNKDIPISVTLPTKLDSVLKIRDYGTGLSPDRIKDVFVNYGSSTKRSDNSQTGGFGIGAKSAWAYTDSFTVLSYYNGKLRSYIAHTGKNSNGTLELIGEDDTSEKNGVEVQIPVRENDIEQFVHAVYRCTFFWDVKPELKGITKLEIPAAWLDSNKNIVFKNENWFLVEKNEFIKRLFDAYNPDIFVLIDKIPYSINKFSTHELASNVHALRNSSYSNYMNFVEVDNGLLEISATRESVSDKDDSKRKVNQICGEAMKNMVACLEKEFDKDFATIEDYIKFYFSTKGTFNFTSLPKKFEFAFKKDGFSYKYSQGRIISPSFDGCRITKYFIKKQKSRTVLRIEENHPIEIDSPTNVKFVLDDSTKRYTVKDKIKKVFADNPNLNAVYAIENYTSEQLGRFKQHLKAEHMSDLPYEKVSFKQKREEGKVSYRTIRIDGSRVLSGDKTDAATDDIENSGKEFVIVPFSGDEMYHDDTFRENVKFLNDQGKYTVIKASKKDYELIVDSCDNVYAYDEVAADLPGYVDIEDSIIETYVARRAGNSFQFIGKFIGKIDCPKIKEYFEIRGTIKEQNNVRVAIPDRILSAYPRYVTINANIEKMNNLEEQINTMYPLLKCVLSNLGYYSYNWYGRDRDNAKEQNRLINDLVFYINTKASK